MPGRGSGRGPTTHPSYTLCAGAGDSGLSGSGSGPRARTRRLRSELSAGLGDFRLPPPVEGEGGRDQSSPTRIALTFLPVSRFMGYPLARRLYDG